ncbi:MAG: glutamine--fructose-6-phosphate transaminase (isomerizing) [Clostridia bacterium]|nr:glutamine--fructose-6-phosphate transaminase (isomerizing) [Clostridia bacterium]
MCGIIGYIGERQAPDILIDGLQKLEYRGYDSAGIAVFDHNSIKVIKTEGKVSALAKKKAAADLQEVHCGIGHTRWATHGEPSDINAHPHSVGRVTLVHNGIIENYAELGERYHPSPLSRTDTEIAAAVINACYHGDAVSAIFEAVNMFHGAYALCIMFEDQPDTVYAIRKSSPLIVAVGENETFLASDIPAILSHTKDYYLPEKGELAILTKQGVRFVGATGESIEKELKTADWDESAARKNGYDHYMLKEIFEQPAVIEQTILRYKNDFTIFENEDFDFEVKGNIHIVACGSAYHAGLMGKYAIEKLARVPVLVHIASEFRYDNPILHKDDLVIAISQSGETADTLAAVRLAKEHNVRTLGIVNVRGSSLSRLADHTLYTLAGPEIAVATTKAYLCQVCLLQLLAVRMAGKGLTMQEYKDMMVAFEALPAQIEQALSFCDDAKALAEKFKNAEHIFFMGRGQDSCLAMEASLKLKEISYIHSEAYAAGELKHGTISLITENTPIISIMTDRNRLPKTASNLKETGARGALITAVTYSDVRADAYTDEQISIPVMNEMTAPLIAAVKLQLLAYYVALSKGCDIDQPRNLAKSVTVE